MKKRNWISITLAGLIILAMIAYFNFQGSFRGQSAKVVRVSALLNLTGPAARFDAIKKQALDLAVERLKTQRPDLDMIVNIADAGGAPDTTVAAARKALNDGAAYILTGTSPAALTVAGLARGRTPAVVQIANAANPVFGPPRPGEYRFWPDWNQEAQVVAAQLRAEGIRSVVVIYSADPYSEALQSSLASLVKVAPEIVIRSQQYDPAATPDFRPLLLRALDEGVGALVVFGLPPGIKALMGQLADIKWSKPVIGGVNTNLTIEEYDKVGLQCGLWVVETEAMKGVLSAGSEAELFRTAYQKAYGLQPPFHALYLADALYFIATANSASEMGSAKSTIDKASAVRIFDGPSGTIRIGEDGVLALNLSIRKIR